MVKEGEKLEGKGGMRNQKKKGEDYKAREEKKEGWDGEVEMKNRWQNELSMGREEK